MSGPRDPDTVVEERLAATIRARMKRVASSE
jgi:hypothetical protein